MGTSAPPSVYSLPGVVQDATVPNNSSWASSPTIGVPAPVPITSHLVRHQVVRHVSTPSETFLQSPLRHHRRTASVGRPPIRETLNACVTYDDEEDGSQGIRINQYVVFSSCRSLSGNRHIDRSAGTLLSKKLVVVLLAQSTWRRIMTDTNLYQLITS